MPTSTVELGRPSIRNGTSSSDNNNNTITTKTANFMTPVVKVTSYDQKESTNNDAIPVLQIQQATNFQSLTKDSDRTNSSHVISQMLSHLSLNQETDPTTNGDNKDSNPSNSTSSKSSNISSFSSSPNNGVGLLQQALNTASGIHELSPRHDAIIRGERKISPEVIGAPRKPPSNLDVPSTSFSYSLSPPNTFTLFAQNQSTKSSQFTQSISPSSLQTSPIISPSTSPHRLSPLDHKKKNVNAELESEEDSKYENSFIDEFINGMGGMDDLYSNDELHKYSHTMLSSLGPYHSASTYHSRVHGHPYGSSTASFPNPQSQSHFSQFFDSLESNKSYTHPVGSYPGENNKLSDNTFAFQPSTSAPTLSNFPMHMPNADLLSELDQGQHQQVHQQNVSSPSSHLEHPLGEHPSRTLFVRNISSNIDDEQLKDLFEAFGPIRSMYSHCKHRGFIMISYYDIRHAKNAMKNLQHKIIHKRKIDIHYSIPKENPSERDLNQGTLVVFNLDPSIINDELRQLFGRYGEIKEIRETPNKKHHKFIEFYDVRDADRAMKHLNKTELKGKKIKIEPSRPGGTRRNFIHPWNLDPLPAGTTSTEPGSMENALLDSPPLMSENVHYSTSLSPSLKPSATPPQFDSPIFEPLQAYHQVPPLNSQMSNYFPSQNYFSHSAPTKTAASSTTANNPIPGSVTTPYLHHSMGNHNAVHGVNPNLANGGNNYHYHQNQSNKPASIGGNAITTSKDYHSYNYHNYQHQSQNQHHHQRHHNRNINQISVASPAMSSAVPTRMVNTTGSPSGNSNGNNHHHHHERRRNKGTSDSKKQFALDLEKVKQGIDKRTTLMIKNIPNKYTQKMLLQTIDNKFKSQYDFFYLPIDFKNRCNVGYAFINFSNPISIIEFSQEFNNKKWEKFNSEKVCEITYARIQGKANLISHFQNSSLMVEDPSCRPIFIAM